MNLEEQYKQETGSIICYLGSETYSENYVHWLENKIKELQKENSEYLFALKVIEKEVDTCKDKLKGMMDE